MGLISAPAQPSDDDSIERGFASDDVAIRAAALEGAVQRYSWMIEGLVSQHFSGKLHEHDRAAIVNEVFRKIWVRLDRGPWKIHKSLAGLLRKTGIWAAYGFIRSRRTWTDRHVPIEDSLAVETATADAQQPWEGIERQESLRKFAGYVSQLPDLQRAVGQILARHFEAADTLPSKREIVAILARDGRVTTEASVKSCVKEITRKFQIISQRHEQTTLW